MITGLIRVITMPIGSSCFHRRDVADARHPQAHDGRRELLRHEGGTWEHAPRKTRTRSTLGQCKPPSARPGRPSKREDAVTPKESFKENLYPLSRRLRAVEFGSAESVYFVASET